MHFMERGYAGVTLLDVANDLGIKQASLYYHAPGGKQDLFGQVVRFAVLRNARGIEAAVGRGDATAREKLEAVIDWLSGQPPFPLMRLLGADFSHLDEGLVEELSALAKRAILGPIRGIFSAASKQGAIRAYDPEMLACAFLSMLYGVNNRPERVNGVEQRRAVYHDLLDIFFDGLHVNQ